MWKKWVSLLLLSVLLISGAVAEGKDIVLNMPESLTEMEENDCERVCMSLDGETRIEILTLEGSEEERCGEVFLEELCELRTNCPESFEIAVLSEEPFEGCPAKRVAYTYEIGDGMTYRAQAMAIWTEKTTFVVFVLGEDEAFTDAVFAALTLSED